MADPSRENGSLVSRTAGAMLRNLTGAISLPKRWARVVPVVQPAWRVIATYLRNPRLFRPDVVREVEAIAVMKLSPREVLLACPGFVRVASGGGRQANHAIGRT